MHLSTDTYTHLYARTRTNTEHLESSIRTLNMGHDFVPLQSKETGRKGGVEGEGGGGGCGVGDGGVGIWVRDGGKN